MNPAPRPYRPKRVISIGVPRVRSQIETDGPDGSIVASTSPRKLHPPA